MEKAYYKQYYDFERNHWWFLARAKILEAYVSNFSKSKLKILDAGTGTGANSIWLSNYGEVVSMEFDKDCIDYSSQKNGLDYINGSLLELPFTNDSFDLICAFDVIEHIEDHHLAVSEMIRVCKPGGKILITVPAFMHLWSEHDEINHHFRRYTRNELSILFDREEGELQNCSYFNFYLYPLVLMARFANKLLSPFQKSDGHKSDFEKFKPGLLNDTLKQIFLLERNRIASKKKYPFGVSLILEWQKDKPAL
ncbi:class I SAM-dependent methyltransferase [Hyphobacterium sp. CCMP332]|nr:class I SAM-dependent methyltransferase [Hyphobacterium sp. CCMP332]